MRRTRTIIGIGFLVAAAAAFWIWRPDRLIHIASAAVSQTVCTKVFVTGLTPVDAYAQNMAGEGGMALIDWALRFEAEPRTRRVRTTVFGAFETEATYTEGYGCRLTMAGNVPLAPYDRASGTTASLPDIGPPSPVEPQNAGVRAAIDRAMAPRAGGPPRWTHAIVVVHDGRVIAERYAPGIGLDTALLSHSIAKSVTTALLGILARDGALRVQDSVPSPAWAKPVSIDQLVRMNAGLPLDEGMGPGISQRMWFAESDHAAFAQSTPLETAPGTRWAYSNLSYAVLSRVVAAKAGATPAGTAAFAARELFAPLGMRTAIMEFDGAGVPKGSNAMLASARDWARFGLLYLNDGMAGGRRILPEGWVAAARRQTPDSGYGAGFWLNNIDTPNVWGRPWGLPGAPKDAYFARGYLGQFLVIVPSANLVVVRMGVDRMPGGGIEDVGTLVGDIVAALD
jgi:hypothetical protein